MLSIPGTTLPLEGSLACFFGVVPAAFSLTSRSSTDASLVGGFVWGVGVCSVRRGEDWPGRFHAPPPPPPRGPVVTKQATLDAVKKTYLVALLCCLATRLIVGWNIQNARAVQ